ncbi:hypothetical protein RvY_15236 [Ramazzottius varieornatus]|uniref:RRM domain-containing protein n=1 Tax=Ramazzottius varieornatus TaxID=947166 RepID=A0A1D1VYY2_RAMVA|nr:hypothetical protein RvY_15236 [Ramazzottius varieornatus]
MGDRDRDRRMSNSRVYVGNLPPDVRERDIEDVFRKYGRVQHCDLRTNKGPPFAFVDFEDKRDAEDAVHGRDGYDLDGYKIRVEFPRALRDRDGGRGGNRFGDRNGGGFGGRGGYGDRRGGGFGGDRRGGGANLRRSKYRVIISGLPPSGSWQDLKDHLREAGDVCYADVSKDGSGVAEFMRYEDMKYAIKKLDDTKFRSHEGETGYIRIKAEDRGSRSPRSPAGRSRSRSPVTRAPRATSPGAEANGEKRGSDSAAERSGGGKRDRSGSRSRSRSSHSKSRSKTPASRSPSRERE